MVSNTLTATFRAWRPEDIGKRPVLDGQLTVKADHLPLDDQQWWELIYSTCQECYLKNKLLDPNNVILCLQIH